MMVSKNKSLSIIGLIIILIVYTAIVFLLPFSRNESFWVGYGFSMIAFFLTAAVSFYSLGREGIKSKFYRFPLIYIARIYLIVQIIFGFIFIIISIIPLRVSLIISILWLGLCCIGLIATNIGTEVTESIDKSVSAKVFYIKSMQTDVEILAEKTNDFSLKIALQDLSQTIRYSDPMSSEQLATIEAKIVSKVEELINTVEVGKTEEAKEACNTIQGLFLERNKKCKILK